MNQRQPIDPFGALFASLFYTCKRGNLIYILILATVASPVCVAMLKAMRGSDPFSAPQPPFLPLLLLLGILLMSVCKNMDNAARIRAGLENSPVPVSPNSTNSAPERYLGGIILLLLVVKFLDFIGRFFYIALIGQVATVLAFVILAPAMTLSFLNHRTATSVISPGRIMAAIGEIGIGRYIIMLLIASVASGIAFFILREIITSPTMHKFLLRLTRALGISDGSPFFIHLLCAIPLAAIGFIWSFKDNYYAFFYPRIPISEMEDDLDDSAILATLSAAGMTPPAAQDSVPAPNKRLPPTDLSLLRDADTGNMDMETQQDFARALAEADDYIRTGAPDKAIPILAAWTTARHDIAAYYPAYARLYPLDPQPALRARLIEAAARGDGKSYRLIAADLATIDPADIPVNHILPLVQLAAKAQEHRSVINLTRHFAKNHPDHPHLVENYYHAARALAKTGAPDKAAALLKQLLARYPEHPKAAHIRYALEQTGGKT